MIDLLQKSDRINIANRRCYVNQTKNKSGEFSEERLAFGTSYSPLLALRLFLEGKMKRCFKCKQDKPLSEFYLYKTGKNKGYYGSYCKKCDIIDRNERIKKDSPWVLHYKCAKTRCVYGKYKIKNRKMLMKIADFKFLWFRDKAYLLKRPTIDRINNNGNYTLDNCQFIELIENIKKGRS